MGQGFAGPRAGVNVSAGTAGTELAQSGTVVFSNANNVTFGMTQSASSYVVTASGAVPYVFSNSNAISFGTNGSTVTAKLPTVSYWDNRYPLNANAAATNSAAANLSMQRISLPFGMSATRADVLGHLTVAGSNVGTYTMSLGIYTMSGSTASLASSGTVTAGWNGVGATNQVGAYLGQSGTRWRSITLGTWNMTPGEYMLGFMLSQVGVVGTTGSWTIFGNSSIAIGAAPGGGNVADYFDDGIYSAATGAFPASMHVTQIVQTGANAVRQPFVAFAGTF